MNVYQYKYLKYKNKYLNLKNLNSQIGGGFLGDLFKSKAQIEAEKNKLREEELRLAAYDKAREEKIKEVQQKQQAENARKIKEQEDLNKLKIEYEEIGYQFVPYKYMRINIETPLDKAHFEFKGNKGFIRPPGTKKRIELDESKNAILGLKEKMITFKKKYYDPFVKLGYNYIPSTDSYRDYNQNTTFPEEPAYFFISNELIKHPHSQKIIIANRFYTKPPLPAFDTWEQKPDVKPGPEWRKISSTSPEWDPQNQYFWLKETWVKQLESGKKPKIEEREFDSELLKLTK